MTEKIDQVITVPHEYDGMRLDQALARLLPDFSRTQIQLWIKNGDVTIQDKPVRTRYTLKTDEIITIHATRKSQPLYAEEAIPLDTLFEDEDILILNKPVGMVVHPAAGHYEHTLLNALLHHIPNLKTLPRAGIVHRLDKDTSGLLVIAKNHRALKGLIKQLKNHSMERTYQAIVSGVLTSGGTIDEPIGRHPIQRLRMAVIETGKPAITHYRVMERYAAYTRVKVQLETGRTHQIRVHFNHIHHPLLGDPTYGGRFHLPKGASPKLVDCLRQFKRQALHAAELGLSHPVTQEWLHFQAPLPADMQDLIRTLQNDNKEK